MQQRVLVRARGLSAFRRALTDLAIEGAPLSARRRVVIVPTRASAELLRQTIEHAAAARGRTALLLPDIVTRDEWISRLHAALPGTSPLLTRVEREVMLERAARRAGARPRMGRPPLHVRPGLVAAMLEFYDELQRRQRTVRRFSRTLFDQLRGERGMDRGSEGLIHQTCFLGFAFLAYQRGVAASGAQDEHSLRARLLLEQPDLSCDHVVIAVADHPSDPRGLWPADFDLIGRLRSLGRVDVVMTDETHDAGFRDRLEQELPGIEERIASGEPVGSVLVVPPRSDRDDRQRQVFVSRDREEEVRDVARAIRSRATVAGGALREATAIVFHRPLPYLYLTQQVLADAKVPYEAFDALPLAAEPYAALLDLVLVFARTGGTREAAVALLRSTLIAVAGGDDRLAAGDVAALDAVLAERRAAGEATSYVAEVEAHFGGRPTRHGLDAAAARRAARAAAAVHDELRPFRSGASASEQVAAIAAFLREHEGDNTSVPLRARRARAAVLGALDGLADAYRRHDDGPRPHEHVTAAIHHAIEAQTFTPRQGQRGVHLVDAIAARFGEFDHAHLVGLVETDWPERPRRSIFYTSGLLRALGWPQESDQTRAQQAAFRDLARLPRLTLRLHAFELEGDAIVALSPMVEMVRGVPTRDADPIDARVLFSDERLALARPIATGLDEIQSAWLALRLSRPTLDDVRYRGSVGAQLPRAYRVSRVDRYVDCPFKYFSESVLALPEEREETSGLSPLERGTLLHALFERFYKDWHAQGGRELTVDTLPAAMVLFRRITDDALERLPEADRALEHTRLLGSIVSRGVAERVFELEVDAGGRIADRLLEVDLIGPFTFPVLGGLRQKTIEIRGKADRVDVFDDGGIRVIDYKLGRLPDVETSIQIGVYAHTARQRLEAIDGRPHPIKAASYLAFGDDRKLEGRIGGASEPPAFAAEARAAAFAAAIENIERGEFPARPLRPADCQWCRYAGVCRKEYLVEDDDPAEPV